jgi:hypothetical protein
MCCAGVLVLLQKLHASDDPGAWERGGTGLAAGTE